jgi:murein DD-endopeptidase MepM/ murein hydrolase activator NlpD/LysM repeat protein
VDNGRVRRGKAWVICWGAALALATILVMVQGNAILHGQILQPEDIATPTPTLAWSLLPTPTPTGIPPVPSLDTSGESSPVYFVKEGDTVWSVAIEMGLDVEEVPCTVAPNFRSDTPLVIGDALTGLPAGWRCHQTAAGETLAAIAAQYGAHPRQVAEVAWNGLGQRVAADQVLPAGHYLRIPAGEASEGSTGGFLAYMLDQPVETLPLLAYAVGGPKAAVAKAPVPANWPYGSGNFAWPVYGWLSQGYRNDHRALDIAAPAGTVVTAADRGVVVRAGWNNQGYGYFVVIDHNIDYVTLYSHLQDVYVREGDIVGQGALIGTVGSTGNSTGPHLHFEIRDFGRRTNPIELLTR